MITENLSCKTTKAPKKFGLNILLKHRPLWKSINLKRSDLDGCCAEDVAIFPPKKSWASFPKNNIGLPDLRLPHKNWTEEELNSIQITHLKPKCFTDHCAYISVSILRLLYDVFSGYKFGYITEHSMINRVIILETIAAIPGMIGATVRHLRSIRHMIPDYGYIHTLLEEAENERMHLMTALLLKKPGIITKILVNCGQIFFATFYATMYCLSSRYCHRFVGYLEEEAVKTYTGIVDHIDQGDIPGFEIPAPPAARAYWNLPKNATLRDIWLSIRADEAHHREVNHELGDIVKIKNSINPILPGH